MFTLKHTYILTFCKNTLNLNRRFIIFKFHLTETMAENVVLPLNLESKVSDACNSELNEPDELLELPTTVWIDLDLPSLD